jgi:hypothetical protein
MPFHLQKIKLRHCSDGEATFEAGWGHFRPGSRVSFEIADTKVELEVTISTLLEHKRALYQGRIVSGEKALRGHLNHSENRQRTRLRHRMRVLSDGISGFQTLTRDFTPEGAQVDAAEPIQVGSEISVVIDVDWAEIEPLKLKTRVIWCTPDVEGYRVGLEFVDVPQTEASILQAVYDELQIPERTSVAVAVSRHLSMPIEYDTNPPPRHHVIETVDAQLQAYHVDSDGLTITLLEHGTTRTLKFEDSLYLRDRGALGRGIKKLDERLTSKELIEARSHCPISLEHASVPLHHYRLLSEEGTTLLEWISTTVVASPSPA